MSYIDVDDYVSTPRSSTPDEKIADLVLVVKWLLDELDKADAVIADHERRMNELHAELAGLEPTAQTTHSSRSATL